MEGHGFHRLQKNVIRVPQGLKPELKTEPYCSAEALLHPNPAFFCSPFQPRTAPHSLWRSQRRLDSSLLPPRPSPRASSSTAASPRPISRPEAASTDPWPSPPLAWVHPNPEKDRTGTHPHRWLACR